MVPSPRQMARILDRSGRELSIRPAQGVIEVCPWR
jgi:hypothetical protein